MREESLRYRRSSAENDQSLIGIRAITAIWTRAMPTTATTPPLRPDLEALRRFDATAWAAFYDALAGPLLGYLRGMGAPEPEDVLGETFVQVARDLPRFTGAAHELRPWVYTIARHRMIDATRARQRRPVTPADLTDLESAATNDTRGLVAPTGSPVDLRPSTPSDYDRVLDRALIEHALRELTTDQREVIWMRFFMDLDTAEVGAITGRSANAVAALTTRALSRLHQQLQGFLA